MRPSKGTWFCPACAADVSIPRRTARLHRLSLLFFFVCARHVPRTLRPLRDSENSRVRVADSLRLKGEGRADREGPLHVRVGESSALAPNGSRLVDSVDRRWRQNAEERVARGVDHDALRHRWACDRFQRAGACDRSRHRDGGRGRVKRHLSTIAVDSGALQHRRACHAAQFDRTVDTHRGGCARGCRVERHLTATGIHHCALRDRRTGQASDTDARSVVDRCRR